MEYGRFFLVLKLLALVSATTVLCQGTRVGFYASTCPEVETIVRSTVESHLRADISLAAGLLRIHFRDCFVRGCDASVLIDGPNTEKTATTNLKGHEIIDDAKAKLEAACPGVVSCADILTLATRDSVVLTGGPCYQVPTGRRDGRVSKASEALNLPGPRDSVDVQKQKFAAKGLNTQDLVTLVGAHTLGTTSCGSFSNRLYNFTNNGPDPTIDPSFLPQLRALCPQNGDASRRVAFDTGSQNKFDASFFANLRKGRGILQSDQLLWTDPSTKSIVEKFMAMRGLSGSTIFNVEFGKAMVKMSNIGVKTGTEGEIRTKCTAIN